MAGGSDGSLIGLRLHCAAVDIDMSGIVVITILLMIVCRDNRAFGILAFEGAAVQIHDAALQLLREPCIAVHHLGNSAGLRRVVRIHLGNNGAGADTVAEGYCAARFCSEQSQSVKGIAFQRMAVHADYDVLPILRRNDIAAAVFRFDILIQIEPVSARRIGALTFLLFSLRVIYLRLDCISVGSRCQRGPAIMARMFMFVSAVVLSCKRTCGQHTQAHNQAQKESKGLFASTGIRWGMGSPMPCLFSHIFSSLESISGCFRSNQTSCSSIFAKYRSLALFASPLSSANFISAMSNSRHPQCPGWVGKQMIFKYVSISGLWAISSSVSP